MNWKGFLLGGLAAGIAIFVVNMLFGMFWEFIFPGFNAMMLALPGMRAITDPVMVLYFLHPFVVGFAMSLFYQHFKAALKGTRFHRGLKYGFMVWVLAAIPSIFMVYSSMNYPTNVVIMWATGPLLYYPLAGIVIARLSG